MYRTNNSQAHFILPVVFPESSHPFRDNASCIFDDVGHGPDVTFVTVREERIART